MYNKSNSRPKGFPIYLTMLTFPVQRQINWFLKALLTTPTLQNHSVGVFFSHVIPPPRRIRQHHTTIMTYPLPLVFQNVVEVVELCFEGSPAFGTHPISLCCLKGNSLCHSGWDIDHVFYQTRIFYLRPST